MLSLAGFTPATLRHIRREHTVSAAFGAQWANRGGTIRGAIAYDWQLDGVAGID
jgi:hypothetical protein